MINKTSPGPWTIEKDITPPWKTADFDWRITDRDGFVVTRFDADEANARLMTAAPDLLEALESLLTAIGGEESTDIWCVDARAAIAKAKGEI